MLIFKFGDSFWIIEWCYTVIEVIVKKVSRSFCIIKYLAHNGGYRVKKYVV